MKNQFLFMLFLFWSIHAMSQNKEINLNERGKIEMETEGTFTTTSDDVTCNPNAYESNSFNGNAHPINLNATYKAGIQKRSDKDFYKFILNAPSDVVVTLKDLPQNYDLILKNSAGKQFGLLGNKTGTADETITVNALVAGTYYVQVYGYNRAFDANKCYTLKVATPTASVCATPTGLKTTVVRQRFVELDWNPVAGAQSYTAEYKEASVSSWVTLDEYTTGSYPLLGNLKSNTIYNWRVKANCSSSSSSEYTEGSFTSPATTTSCATPTGLKTTRVGTSFADVAWDAVAGAQSYTLGYKAKDDLIYWFDRTIPNTTTFSIANLPGGKEYVWRVKANCTTGGSSEYAQHEFTSPDVNCGFPENLSASTVTNSTAVLKWTPHRVGKPLSYTVEYKEASLSDWTIVSGVTNLTHTLSSLKANTIYNWRVKAICSALSSSDYTEGTFTTTGTTTSCATPTGLKSTRVSASFAEVAWDAVAGAQDYTVGYKYKEDPDSYFTDSTNPRTVLYMQFANLVPNKEHVWRVKANCTNGGSSEYVIDEFTTAETYCGYPLNLDTSNVTDNTAVLKWTRSPYGAAHISYVVEYKEASVSDWTVVSGVTDVTHTLTSLKSNTIYNWRVKADCSALNISGYKESTFTTTGTTTSCATPTGLKSTRVSASFAEVAWDAVAGAQDYTVGYKYKEDPDSYFTDSTNPRTVLYMQFANLVPNKEHVWRVKANCTNGGSSEYVIDEFTTAETYCGYPLNLDTSNVTDNTAVLKWTRSPYGAAHISYVVEYKEASVSDWTVVSGVTDVTHTLISLKSNTIYNWRVKADCSALNISGYKESTFTTTGTTTSCATPTGLSTDNVMSNSANLKWDLVSGAQSYAVEYKTSTSSVWGTPISIATTIHPLQGLTSNTIYNWRVKANCSALSSSEYAQGIFATTSDEVDCNPNAYEPNSYNGNAHLINLNTTYKAGIQKRSDKDFYRFILNTPSDIVVTLKDLPQNYDLIVKNSAGKQFGLLGNKMGTADETITINSLVAGTYYVQVYGYNRAFDENQCYALRVNATSASKSSSILNENIVNDKTIVTLYPNPVEGIVNIKGIISNQKFTQLTITDISGGIVKTSQVKVEDIIRIDVSDLSPNVYYLTILGESFRFIKK